MKSKLNHVLLILGFFLFKVVIIDNFRFNNNNSNSSQVASTPKKKDVTLAAIR